MEFPELLRKNNVKMLIHKEPNILYEDASLEDVILSLNNKSVSCCVIIEKSSNKLLGVISESDILNIAKQGKFDKKSSVKGFITGYDAIESPERSIASIVKKMYKSDFKSVLIVDSESESPVQGVVSVRDFVSHLIEYFPETVYNILPGQKLSTEDREGA